METLRNPLQAAACSYAVLVMFLMQSSLLHCSVHANVQYAPCPTTLWRIDFNNSFKRGEADLIFEVPYQDKVCPLIIEWKGKNKEMHLQVSLLDYANCLQTAGRWTVWSHYWMWWSSHHEQHWASAAENQKGMHNVTSWTYIPAILLPVNWAKYSKKYQMDSHHALELVQVWHGHLQNISAMFVLAQVCC